MPFVGSVSSDQHSRAAHISSKDTLVQAAVAYGAGVKEREFVWQLSTYHYHLQLPNHLPPPTTTYYLRRTTLLPYYLTTLLPYYLTTGARVRVAALRPRVAALQPAAGAA